MKYRFDILEDSPVQSTEPHFDDERTLLTARPVVPLEKINAKARHRKQWFLGGAFAVAMMLGVASALLASYFKLRNVQTAPAEVSQEVDVPATPLAVAENPPPDTETPLVEVQAPAVIEAATEEPTPAEITPKKQTLTKHTTAAAHQRDDYVAPPNDDRQINEEDELNRIRDSVLYEEWQERRARRAIRRERRRAERYNHRDLSNLDEIFEGRRRPNP
jgi:hypothetical protein